MTSAERREARYQRRKAARLEKKEKTVGDALDFDRVFTFAHLYRSALRCFRGVNWKASVQSFRCRCGIRVAKRLRELRSGVFKLRKSPEFKTRERGHERQINSIYIDDRVPQKCACMYALKPVLHRTLIYDNYASQEGKGTSKARKRLKCMLERHIRRHGMVGGVIIFDFKGFFDSIPHGLVRYVLGKNFTDKRIIGLNMKIVRQAREKVGLVLGSENSQDFAISTPNLLDHLIKDVMRAEAYGRYMDDGIIIDPDMDKLKRIFQALKDMTARLGFKLNERKSRILRFGKPFTILQRKYTFPASGKIIIRPARMSVVRERRKLKRLYSRFCKGTMKIEAGMDSLTAWKSSIADCRCWKIVRSIGQLFDSLYINRWLSGEEERTPCTTRSFPAARLSMPSMAA